MPTKSLPRFAQERFGAYVPDKGYVYRTARNGDDFNRPYYFSTDASIGQDASSANRSHALSLIRMVAKQHPTVQLAVYDVRPRVKIVPPISPEDMFAKEIQEYKSLYDEYATASPATIESWPLAKYNKYVRLRNLMIEHRINITD